MLDLSDVGVQRQRAARHRVRHAVDDVGSALLAVYHPLCGRRLLHKEEHELVACTEMRFVPHPHAVAAGELTAFGSDDGCRR